MRILLKNSVLDGIVEEMEFEIFVLFIHREYKKASNDLLTFFYLYLKTGLLLIRLPNESKIKWILIIFSFICFGGCNN